MADEGNRLKILEGIVRKTEAHIQRMQQLFAAIQKFPNPEQEFNKIQVVFPPQFEHPKVCDLRAQIDAVCSLESEATPTQSRRPSEPERRGTPAGILDADDEVLGLGDKDREVSGSSISKNEADSSDNSQRNGIFNEAIEEPQTEASFAEAGQIGALAAGENEDIGGSTASQIQHEFSKGDVLNKLSDPTNKSIKEPQIIQDSFKVYPNPLAELVNLLIDWIEIRLVYSEKVCQSGFWLNAIECFLSAHKVFVEMPNRRIRDGLVLTVVWGSSQPIIFDLDSGNRHGWPTDELEIGYSDEVVFPFDRGKGNNYVLKTLLEFGKAIFDLQAEILAFDPGGMVEFWIAKLGSNTKLSICPDSGDTSAIQFFRSSVDRIGNSICQG